MFGYSELMGSIIMELADSYISDGTSYFVLLLPLLISLILGFGMALNCSDKVIEE